MAQINILKYRQNMKRFLLIIALAIFAGNLFAQKADSAKIEKLQQQIEELQLKAFQDSVKHKIYNDVVEYKNQIDSFKNEVTAQNQRIGFVIWLVGGATFATILLALYQFIWGFRNKANELIKQEAEKLTENSFKLISDKLISHEEVLKRMLFDQSIELKLKTDFNILIVYKSEKDNDTIRNFMKQNGFNFEFVHIDKIPDKVTSDVVFIYNPKNEFGYSKDDKQKIVNPEVINLLIDKVSKINIGVFYYNETYVQHNAQGYACTSFANTITTVYHNLIDLMRYKYLVIDKK